MSSSNITFDSPWKIGLRGARANLLPGLALQVFALVLVLAYFWHTPTRGFLERLAHFRGETGFVYSIVATALFGGVIPSLYMRLDPATRDTTPWHHVLFYTLFWAFKGFEVDAFYRFQAWLFGSNADAATVAKKVVFDMFIYCPLWAVPESVVAYAWKDAGYRFRPVFTDIQRGSYYSRRVLPGLISNWGVWIPAVCLIYSLPLPLQIPLFNIVLCFFALFWAYVIAHIWKKR